MCKKVAMKELVTTDLKLKNLFLLFSRSIYIANSRNNCSWTWIVPNRMIVIVVESVLGAQNSTKVTKRYLKRGALRICNWLI